MATSSGASGSPSKVHMLHGYDAVFDPELEKKYTCPVCLAALRDPVQTKCGHRFCKMCLEHSRGKCRYGRCPVDNTWFDPKRHIFEDNAVRREVLSLTIKCDNHLEDCKWTGELRERQDHVCGCPEGATNCPNSCSHQCKKKHMAEHLLDCPNRLQSCQKCGEGIQASELTKHQVLSCEKFPVTCAICGDTGILRENIPRHVDATEGDCPLVLISCKFGYIGCYFQDKRKNMKAHYESANLHHLQLITMKIQQQEEYFVRQQHQMVEITDKCQALTLQTASQQRMLQEQGDVIQVQASCIRELESHSTYDGRLLWRLSVDSRGQGQALTSPSFYTANPGYKVSVVLDPNGPTQDGKQFASLSLDVQEGQFDQVLQFPFEAECQVTVFDQSGGRNNYKCTFGHEKKEKKETDKVSTPRNRSAAQRDRSSISQPVFMETSKLFTRPYMKDSALLILAQVM